MNKTEHDKWLLKMGSHPSQIKSRKGKLPSISCKPETGYAKTYFGELANTICGPVMSNTIWDQIATGNESAATIQAIREKATRVLPAYSKGSLQLISKEMLQHAGRKQ